MSVEENNDKYDLVQKAEWSIPNAITIIEDGDERNQLMSKGMSTQNNWPNQIFG